MKPLSYYRETTVSIPRQDDYMTIYYYKKGVMVGMKRQFETDYEPPKNCVEEKVLDEVSYNAHMKHYQEEVKRLQDEFCEDLIVKYKMSHHSKANKLFNKAWDMGCSGGLEEVEYYFQDLVELFRDEQTIDRRQNEDRRVTSVMHEDHDFIIGTYYQA
jgi:hypothetical protein